MSIENARPRVISPPTIDRKRSEVPPTPRDGDRYVYQNRGYIVDKGAMRWRFDPSGKLIAWFLYRTREERDAGMFPWAEMWSDGR